MVRRRVMIQSENGLHLRPAGQLCQDAMEYDCKVEMVIGEKTYNLKSVISILSAQVNCSREIDLVCDGPEEERALEEMAQFLAGDL